MCVCVCARVFYSTSYTVLNVQHRLPDVCVCLQHAGENGFTASFETVTLLRERERERETRERRERRERERRGGVCVCVVCGVCLQLLCLFSEIYSLVLISLHKNC